MRWPPGSSPSPGLAVAGARDGARAVAPAVRDLRLAGGVDHRVAGLDLDALDGHDRPDDAVLELHLGERVQDDQARAAEEARVAVRLAPEPGHERAMAQDELALLRVGGLLDHERPAREHEPVQDDRGVRLQRELQLVGVGAR